MKRLLVCLLLSLLLHVCVFGVPWPAFKLKSFAASISPKSSEMPLAVGLTDLPPAAAAMALPPPENSEPDAGVSLEVAAGQKPSAAYLDRLSLKIFNAWQYPLSARRAGHEGVVKVFFTLDSGGRLGECRIAASSGFADLDLAATQAVRDGGPYGPFGSEITADKLSITARLRYQLD